MTKFTCPYCYAEHTLLDCDMRCTYNIPGKDVKCAKNVVKDSQEYIPNHSKTGCLKCTAASKLIYCPDVGMEIPRDFLTGPSLPIALIGAKASGKSNYIGVLVQEIRRRMSQRFNCMLSMTSSEESKHVYDNYYYDPLYNQGAVIDSTNKNEILPPLIFPIRFLDNKDRISKTATLTFYDTAGENLNDKTDMVVYNRYLPNSKGIILLLDPLQIPSIRKQLQGKVTLPEKSEEAYAILNRVAENIRSVKNLREKDKIKIPLAIAFTKIDVLEKYDILPEGSCLRDESEHTKRGVFVASDRESCDIEMRALLASWLDDDILQLLNNFTKSSFFGLSSFGDIPVNNRLAGEIKARRVLDPLLWLLAENNYIKTVK